MLLERRSLLRQQTSISGERNYEIKLRVRSTDMYLDWIGHSPCNDGYVFAMLNFRLQNDANLATMVTYCFAA